MTQRRKLLLKFNQLQNYSKFLCYLLLTLFLSQMYTFIPIKKTKILESREFSESPPPKTPAKSTAIIP